MSRTKKAAKGGALSGDVLPPTPRINLSSAEHIRQEMGKVYRDAKGGRLPTSEAAKLVYILSQLLRAVELEIAETIERRLGELEQAGKRILR